MTLHGIHRRELKWVKKILFNINLKGKLCFKLFFSVQLKMLYFHWFHHKMWKLQAEFSAQSFLFLADVFQTGECILILKWEKNNGQYSLVSLIFLSGEQQKQASNATKTKNANQIVRSSWNEKNVLQNCYLAFFLTILVAEQAFLVKFSPWVEELMSIDSVHKYRFVVLKN